MVWQQKCVWDLAGVAVMSERAPKVIMVRQDIPRTPCRFSQGELKRPLAFSSRRGQVFSTVGFLTGGLERRIALWEVNKT